MALSAATVWEVRPSGADTNGGGFKAGAAGTDYSQQDAAQLSLTDLACVTGGAIVTTATGGFTTSMIGNLMQIASGTNFTAGFYEIVGHTDGSTVTLDRDPTTGSNGSAGVFKVGGGLATPQKAVDNIVAGNDVMILTGTYAGSASVACDVAGVDATDRNRLIGYKSGSRSTAIGAGRPTGTDRPLIQMSSGSNHAINVTANYWDTHNIRLDGNAKAAIGINVTSTYTRVRNCSATDVSWGFLSQSNGVVFMDCDVTASAEGFYSDATGTQFIYCRAYDCDARGFYLAAFSVLYRCLADSCGDSTNSGFTFGGTVGSLLIQCVAYKSGLHGLHFNGANTSDGSGLVVGCIFAENGVDTTGYGIAASTDISNMTGFMDYNAFYNGATQDAARNNAPTGSNDVTLTGDPFTAAASDDFTIDNTASEGAALRGVSWPGYLDIGVLQHQETSTGGLKTHPGMAGGMRG